VLFNSDEYLLWFLPLAALGYFSLAQRSRWAVRALVVASLFFYGWWNPRHLPLILASIAANYWIAHRILSSRQPGAWLAAGVAGDLAVLGVFKYTDFFLATFAQIADTPPIALHLALPLGVSFFTFTQIAFLVDVHRARAREPSLDNYALFVTFFPHLLAGPIIHHSEMMPQFASTTNKRIAWENVARGTFLLSLGLAKKMLLADPLVPLVAAGFDHPAGIGAGEAWIAALAYTLQIYFDFSGYTDMALGAALIFNIRLPINFDSPYRSVDLREFWHRWHMTLSRFLREYLYIPLGGNRAPPARVLANLMMTFVLGGLWHGAAWTFVAWGALHGFGMCCHRAWSRAGLCLPRPLAWAVTLLFVVVTWVFFRAASIADALAMLRALVGLTPLPVATSAPAALTAHGAAPALAFAAGVAIVFLRANSNQLARDMSASWRYAAWAAAALIVSILQLGNVTPFLYFNF
jgi:D-alanyl-lipoteichoic acid acyltransferase DltB (MBOAT superfamily)